MGKQYNKVEKRQRRNAYLKRKRVAGKAAKAKPQTKGAVAEPLAEPARA